MIQIAGIRPLYTPTIAAGRSRHG